MSKQHYKTVAQSSFFYAGRNIFNFRLSPKFSGEINVKERASLIKNIIKVIDVTFREDASTPLTNKPHAHYLGRFVVKEIRRLTRWYDDDLAGRLLDCICARIAI